ncbi:MAG: preprotein translocase subunit YajC [Propionicimonas sp.]|uniref:preprotein translocase subunit YajC n=1 Tax=Propionicimonas sp. TaxID=1955623 RepID=UPI003D14E784
MGDNMWSTVLLFVLMGAVLYFLMIRPQQKRQKEQKDLMGSLEPGSRVMLISGIIATVKYLGDKQAVVEISPGVEMTVDKRAISPQPVTDEFEYADDDAEPTDVSTEPVVVPDDASSLTGPVVTDATDPTTVDPAPEATETTWDTPGTDAPGTDKN